ncbi:hypothetical protein HY250_03795 [Candidatus Azambacteria bacterium]|nr:hypothetical protein [Candidatus Azambacteria bacterium]
MLTLQKTLLILLLALVIASPFGVFASHEPLVPCGRNIDDKPDTTLAGEEPCTLCHIFVLAQNILHFLMWTAAPVLAALAFAVGGFKILISGANPGLRQDGFKIIKNTLWGLLIVFGAWIIVNELLQFFANSTFSSPWDDITCVI